MIEVDNAVVWSASMLITRLRQAPPRNLVSRLVTFSRAGDACFLVVTGARGVATRIELPTATAQELDAALCADPD